MKGKQDAEGLDHVDRNGSWDEGVKVILISEKWNTRSWRGVWVWVCGGVYK